MYDEIHDFLDGLGDDKLENFLALIKKFGYKTLNEFLLANSGAMDSILYWIADKTKYDTNMHLEGQDGLDRLTTLAKAWGFYSLPEMLTNNPDSIDAMVDWAVEENNKEWRRALVSGLSESASEVSLSPEIKEWYLNFLHKFAISDEQDIEHQFESGLDPQDNCPRDISDEDYDALGEITPEQAEEMFKIRFGCSSAEVARQRESDAIGNLSAEELSYYKVLSHALATTKDPENFKDMTFKGSVDRLVFDAPALGGIGAVSARTMKQYGADPAEFLAWLKSGAYKRA